MHNSLCCSNRRLVLYLSQQTTVPGPNNFSRIYMHQLRIVAPSAAAAKHQQGNIHEVQLPHPLGCKPYFAGPIEGWCYTRPRRLPFLVQIIFPEFTCINSVPTAPLVAAPKRQQGSTQVAEQPDPLGCKHYFVVPIKGWCCTRPHRLPFRVQIISPEFTCINSVPTAPPAAAPKRQQGSTQVAQQPDPLGCKS